MRILGVLIVSLTPLIWGLFRYLKLKDRYAALHDICLLFKKVLDEIEYSRREIAPLLAGEDRCLKFLKEGSLPLKPDSEKCREQGFSEEDYKNIAGFFRSVQQGDVEYVQSMGGMYLNNLRAAEQSALNDFKEKGRLFCSLSMSLAAAVFLVLI